MVCGLHWDRVRVEWGVFGPFSFSPCNNDIANAECISVLGSKVLDDAFETIEPVIALTASTVAQEELFAKLFG
jgi:hypothetical protein